MSHLETDILAPERAQRQEAVPTTESGRLRHETAARVETVRAHQDILACAAKKLGFHGVPPHLSVLGDGSVSCRCGLDLGAGSSVPEGLTVHGDLLFSEDSEVAELPADLVAFGKLKLNSRLSAAYRQGALRIPAGVEHVRALSLPDDSKPKPAAAT